MSSKLLQPWNSAFQPEWAFEDIRITFFKCVRWQVEETFDPINCPYHYFCDSTYPGNYPPYVDVIVFLFATASYLATLVIMDQFYISSSCIGPAILQLLYVSSLAFDIGVDKDVRYALYEASTISGILHGSLYLDSIILPYYTGFDALVSSTFSGECQSCVCRREVLLVGGKLVTYRGWSVTTFLVVGALCLRIIRRMSGQNSSTIMAIKSLLESSGISITLDCIYLTRKAPPEQPMMRITAFGSILALVCLHLTKKLSSHTTRCLENYMNRIPMRSRKG
ncbi:hypothetical protein GH714_021920 [Hevea brasiliensis]|uniref:Uncharacterized protein n=1 Tax=Hevea brasiliensis TaxID=3981 RepID=A0A6A6NIG5_HEVBR|nr:hypothetical protein GH714_021920 [Hevea brasiliensis]